MDSGRNQHLLEHWYKRPQKSTNWHETRKKEKEQVVKKRTQRGTNCKTVAELEAINENDSRKDTGYDKEKKIITIKKNRKKP